MTLICWFDWTPDAEEGAAFLDARVPDLACAEARRSEEEVGDGLRTWAPAAEQAKTPTSAAAKSWNFKVIPWSVTL
jgi:hypothetical protein